MFVVVVSGFSIELCVLITHRIHATVVYLPTFPLIINVNIPYTDPMGQAFHFFRLNHARRARTMAVWKASGTLRVNQSQISQQWTVGMDGHGIGISIHKETMGYWDRLLRLPQLNPCKIYKSFAVGVSNLFRENEQEHDVTMILGEESTMTIYDPSCSHNRMRSSTTKTLKHSGQILKWGNWLWKPPFKREVKYGGNMQDPPLVQPEVCNYRIPWLGD